jgi:Gpi18-like mannosyltransferase
MKKFFSQDKEIIKFIAVLFLAWRIALLVIAFLGVKFFPSRIDYLGGGVDNYYQKPLFWGWANFDGFHYLNIARQGYFQFEQAFFPFYPFLIRWFAKLFKNFLFSGLLISHLSLFLALILFYKLVRLDFEEKIANCSLVYLLLFPTSFFFGSVYSESLFLVLILGSFYFARKKNWLLAGVLGAFASATRVVGIFLFPALLVEWWEQYKSQNLNLKSQIFNLFSVLLIPLGLGFYMRYLAVHWGDPLLFAHVQEHFGAQRTSGKVILLYQVFWRYFKMILTTRMDPLYFAVWLEFLTAILFFALLIWAYFKKIRTSWLIFSALAYLLPTLTGTFSSLPRYVLVIFPGFIALALLAEKYRWLKIICPVLAGILLATSTIFFIRGFWVS